MKKFLLFFCPLLLCLQLHAQTTVSGTITDQQSGEFLIGASITLIGTQEGTFTEDDGRFSLVTSQSTPFSIRVSYVGFESQEIEISGDTDLNIQMVSQYYLGETVVVSVSRRKEKLSESPASISIIDQKKLKSSAVTHPAQHLRNVLGVTFSQQGVDNYQITLRGRHNTFTASTFYLQDYRNMIAPGTGDLDMGRQGINDIDLDRIEVIRGPGSALYGPGVESGVIHFISRSPFDTGTSISVTGGTQSSLQFAGRFANKLSDKFAYKFLVRYNRAKDFTLDPNDPIDMASIATFQDTVRSALDGTILRTGVSGLEDQTESYGVTATFEYRLGKNGSLTSNTGWNYRKGIVRAGLGEALSDFADYYTQLRYSTPNFFIQGFVNVLNNDDQTGFLYRTGLSSVTKNTGYQFQSQYLFEDLITNMDLAVGLEAQMTINRTQGTVHGKYEDNDDFNIYSAYAQSSYDITDKLELVAAGRVDRFTAIEETAFSPRLALVYKFKPTHTLRATYNRAISSQPALNIFADIPFGIAPVFDIQFIGGVDPITYPDPLITSSFLSGEYTGIDIPLSLPYAVAVSSLGAALQPDLVNYLGSLIPQLSGTSPGALLVNGQVATALPTRDRLRSTKTTSYELGYRGVFGKNFAVSLDVYYNKRKDLVFTGEASPLVLYPTLTPDMTAAFLSASDEATLQSLGTSQAEMAATLAYVTSQFDSGPLGLVEPSIADISKDLPQFVLSQYNVGSLDYYGADLGLNYYINDDFSVYTNFSWLSKNTWNDEELGATGTGQFFALNVADKTLKVGFDNIPSEKGFGYGASIRYQNEVEIREGSIFSGTLDAYSIVDASLNYNFGNGTLINFTAQNLLNQEYRVMPNMPKIGSLFLVNFRKEFE